MRSPEVFRSSPPRESGALERWRQLCGEPLDHLEAVEELLDRAGEAHGWYSREAVRAALLLARLELPDASPWFVGKRAEAVLNLYAELEEHRDGPHNNTIPTCGVPSDAWSASKRWAAQPPGRRTLRTNTRKTLRREPSDGSRSATRTPQPTGSSALRAPMRSQRGAKNPGGESSDKPPEQREIVALLPPLRGEFFPLLLVEQLFVPFQGFVHGAEHGGYFGSVEELPAAEVEQA